MKIGRGTWGKPNTMWDRAVVKHGLNLDEHGVAVGEIIIGSYCSISTDVLIIPNGEHHAEWITSFSFPDCFSKYRHLQQRLAPKSKGNIVIGNDVWIGYGVTILSGVTIGDGAVIGARSVVAKDVEPYSIVVGNPSREVRKRFEKEDIKFLLDLQWWYLKEEEIDKIVPLLMSTSLSALKEYAEAHITSDSYLSKEERTYNEY